MSNRVDIERIQQVLLHRYPFLLLDRVLDYHDGETIHALKNVTVNEPFFTGHFPEKPVMPGVLMLEAMAQAAGVLWSLSYQEDAGKVPLLAGVDQARFRRIVTPGDQMHIHLQVEKKRQALAWFNSEIKVEGEIACQAKLLIALSE